MKNAVFCDVKQNDFCKNRRFEGIQRLHIQGDKNWQVRNDVDSVLQLLVSANIFLSR
jgi:hypothetical protein